MLRRFDILEQQCERVTDASALDVEFHECLAAMRLWEANGTWTVTIVDHAFVRKRHGQAANTAGYGKIKEDRKTCMLHRSKTQGRHRAVGCWGQIAE